MAISCLLIYISNWVNCKVQIGYVRFLAHQLEAMPYVAVVHMLNLRVVHLKNALIIIYAS